MEADVKYEAPAPVGKTKAQNEKTVLFPHIYGLLNLESVTKVYEVNRDADGTFLDVEGLSLS